MASIRERIVAALKIENGLSEIQLRHKLFTEFMDGKEPYADCTDIFRVLSQMVTTGELYAHKKSGRSPIRYSLVIAEAGGQ